MQIGQEGHITRIWYVIFSKLYQTHMLSGINYNTVLSSDISMQVFKLRQV